MQHALKYEEEGLIDPLDNLADKPIFLFHGTLDEIVKEVDVDINFDFFGHQGANLHYNRTMPYCHNFPNNLPVTDFNPSRDCGIDYHPCSEAQACGFANCGEDIVDQYLSYILPNYDSTIKDYSKHGDFLQFNQTEYISEIDGQDAQMSDFGYVYVPKSCRKGGCNLHVFFHGCNESAKYFGYGDKIAKATGLLEHAVANDLIIMFPQVDHDLDASGFHMCWDSLGLEYSGPYSQTNKGA